MTKVQSLKAAFLAGAAALTLTAGAALAHERQSVVLNGQVNFNDVQGLVVVTADAVPQLSAPNLAVGNTVSASTAGLPMNVTSDQTLGASVTATNEIYVRDARGTAEHPGVLVSVANASGNAGQVQGCCGDVLATATQTVNEGSYVGALSNVNVESADNLTSAAQASANSWGASVTRSGYNSWITQTNNGTVEATSFVNGCCNNGALTSSAVAAGNSNAVAGDEGTIYSGVEQFNHGPVRATSAVALHSGTNVTSAASAAGNTAQIQNRWGYAQMDGYQENAGPVEALSSVDLGDWGGFAVSGSNAVGNSALISNLGSDATMSMTQNNFQSGGVSAYSELVGSSSRGGVGIVNATAMGNAATVYACQTCGEGAVKVEGYVNQFNYAPVTATAVANVGTAGSLVVSATAVGNSASFIAAQGRGH